jgi:predicted nucleotidyltransferase
LFGSRARGEADEDSDVDVLVTIDDVTPAERREVFGMAYDADAVNEMAAGAVAPRLLVERSGTAPSRRAAVVL